MKRLFLMAVIFALVSMPFAMAEDKDTSSANWNNYSGIDWLDNVREETTGHAHSYDQYEPEFELGIGTDLIVYENESKGLLPDVVTVETKYDFANENGSAYVVATYNIWDRFFSKSE